MDYQTYREHTVQSQNLHQAACKLMPGGVTASIKYFEPYPIMMQTGQGSKLTDVDGNNYIDYLLCYGALLLGHGHPAITKAVTDTMQQTGTTVFGTPHMLETTIAQTLSEIYPSIEMLRYTNSGLEATLLAIRLAFAYTGKRKLAKFEGHYHGGHDRVLISVNPAKDTAGSAQTPEATSDSLGLPDYYIENTVVLPFNDIEGTDRLLRSHADEIACVIIEPVQAGFIPATQEFMQFLRKLTTELSIVLIYDEVKTGFRVSLGGAQEVYGVSPDLTALGKVVGGGFAIGIVGGKRDILSLCSPAEYSDILSPGVAQAGGKKGVFHSGTYNGHPIVLAAGLAAIDVLTQDGVMNKLFERTSYLRAQLEALYGRCGIPMRTVGMGSIFNMVFTENDIRNYRDLFDVDLAVRKEIDYNILIRGVYVKPLNRYSLSIAHSRQDIDDTLTAHEDAIRAYKRR